MHMVLAGSAAFNRTDAGNGEYFARLYGDRLRYDHRRGRWLLWNGHWWRDDETRTVRRMAIRGELNYTLARRVIELPVGRKVRAADRSLRGVKIRSRRVVPASELARLAEAAT